MQNVDYSLLNLIMLVFATLVLVFFVVAVLTLVAMYVIDVRQTQHAVRRNFPIIGRFRYWFEHLGEFFRQYFFALDREEMPFNRAQRAWVYRASKNVDHTLAFGSTHDLGAPGSISFVSHPFPTLHQDVAEPGEVLIGPFCRQPYRTRAVVNVSAMSYGAISRPAVLALSRGAQMAGCWMNTGEGGLSPYHLEGGADLVFQIGTAKYGVRDVDGRLSDERLREIAAHEQVKMFEIKLSQGAKPGKGGILPGSKVTEEVSRIRVIPVGEDSISPNGHPDIRSVDQLLDMIARVREVTGKPVGVKAVVGGTDLFRQLCAAIVERGADHAAPDFITVDGAEGGTGAAPQSLLDHAGMSIRESLPLIVDTLNRYGLKPRIRVIASGKLITPNDVAWALCTGADFVNSARGFMFALGCIQAMQCHRNTCPTGVTTHDPDLQRGLDPADKAVRVASYVRNMVQEVGIIAHSCGVPEPRSLTRDHARIMVGPAQSMPLSHYYRHSTSTLTVAGLADEEVLFAGPGPQRASEPDGGTGGAELNARQ